MTANNVIECMDCHYKASENKFQVFASRRDFADYLQCPKCGAMDDRLKDKTTLDKERHLWALPNEAKISMTKKELQRFLLEHRGKILAGGRLRTIKSKHLGVDIYEVWTEIETR